MKHYATRSQRDRAHRRSFSYRLKFWFWSDHTKEAKALGIALGGFTVAVLWFGALLFLPHIFH